MHYTRAYTYICTYTHKQARKDGRHERVVCDIEAGLSSLARCLPNTVKVHVNYHINLDSACVCQRGAARN